MARRGGKASRPQAEMGGSSVAVVAGSIKVADDDDVLSVKLSIWDSEVTMRANGAELGNWSSTDIDIRALDATSFEFIAEGDRLIFTPDDPTAFRETPLVESRIGGLKSRRGRRGKKKATADQAEASTAAITIPPPQQTERRRAEKQPKPEKPSRKERRAEARAAAAEEAAREAAAEDAAREAAVREAAAEEAAREAAAFETAREATVAEPAATAPPIIPPAVGVVRSDPVPQPIIRIPKRGEPDRSDDDVAGAGDAADPPRAVHIPPRRAPVSDDSLPPAPSPPAVDPSAASIQYRDDVEPGPDHAASPDPSTEVPRTRRIGSRRAADAASERKGRARRREAAIRPEPEPAPDPEPEDDAAQSKDRLNGVWLRALDTARRYDIFGLDRVPVNEALRGQEHQHTWDHRVAPPSGLGRHICTICGEIRR